MSKKGFSLIELMVVIAIIAVLAAVAVPAYKKYIVGSRMGAAQSAIDGIVQQMIVFASINGHFPTAGELGMDFNILPTTVANPGAISPDLTELYIHDAAFPNVQCGRFGTVTGRFDVSAIGLDSGIAAFSCFLAHVNDSVKVKCFYTYGAGSYTTFYTTTTGISTSILSITAPTGILGTDDIVPGWSLVNTASTPGNYAAMQSFLSDNSNATCMD